MEKKERQVTAYTVVIVILLVILLLLLAFGTYNAYTLLRPKTIVVEKNKTIAKYSLYYDYYSVVSKDNPIWPVGEKLSNKNVYFFETNPVLNVTFNFDLPDSGFNVEYTTKLLIISSDSAKVYWQIERTLSSGSENMSGKKFNSTFSINVKEIKREILKVEQSLGFRGGSKRVKIVTNVMAVGSIGGKSRRISEKVDLEIRISESYYQVLTDPVRGEIAIPSKSAKTVPPSQRDYILASVWILVPFAGIVGSLTAYRYSSAKSIEKEHRKFRKWISYGYMPNVNMTEVEMKSLEDLVDAAIDTNERVIYDESKRIYFFIHGNILYVYRRKKV